MILDGQWLSWLIGLPLAGGVLLLLLPRKNDTILRAVAMLASLATFLVSLYVWFGFDATSAAKQFEEQRAWISAIGASYHVGIDGMSLILVLLTTGLTPLAILGSSSSIRDRLCEFLAFILLLEAAMIGVFVSLDLLLFYVFWEAMLIPMAFLIGIWGGENRVYAAVKFFLYTMAGSVFMLVAILTMVRVGAGALGAATFDLVALEGLVFTPGIELWLFLAFAVAFAIKVPLFPFHTWLPDAHVQAPTAGSVILAGVLLKMGTYGYLRFCLPLFPSAASDMAPVMAWLAIIGIIYGALMAYAQTDLKKLVAYSSVSHLGWVVLGLFAINVIGFEGALLQMVNHGINTGALFLLVGMVYERAHTRDIDSFGGLARIMPKYAVMMMLFTLASIGLPATNGFIGEFSILVGAFQARPLWAVLAALGVVLGALYMLSMYRRIFFGAPSELSRGLSDIGGRELAALVPLAVLVIWIGIAPGAWMAPAKPTLKALDRDMHAKVEFRDAQEAAGVAAAGGAWVMPGVSAAWQAEAGDEFAALTAPADVTRSTERAHVAPADGAPSSAPLDVAPSTALAAPSTAHEDEGPSTALADVARPTLLADGEAR